MAINAYIEISQEEAHKICESVQPEFKKFDKKKFLQAIKKFVEKNEFQVNPDQERVKMLLEGMFNNEKNHGLKYCPCRLITKDYKEDLKLVCPCNFIIHETYKDKEDGECWCGLFVRRKKHG
jgi:ferredoxin-thioredoxin reductase catalytic subunit